MTDPEQATIGDLFRLMTEMKRDVSDLRSEMNNRFDEAAAEREAIRNVVDNDLASQGQVMQLEGKMTDLQRTARQNGQKIDKLAQRMDRAGIPAE